ncbi:MAG: GTPase HflX [Candidatus Poribacteria bacterium]|nr:MAG: GTPase HflX [Candidatus Poribacteria bacterium]
MELFDVRAQLERRERTILVGIEWVPRRANDLEPYESLGELAELANTAGLEVVCQLLVRRERPHPATLIGRGKVEELRHLAEELQADAVLFDEDLTTAQMRNLDRALKVKVLDRTDVILNIFSQRAHTREARIQVELAQWEYSLPRLRRAWTHLDRVVGAGSGVAGGVGTRGPGETQLQMDRRMIQQRIRQLRKELAEVVQHRRVQRKRRKETQAFSVALVGYTNAGKSSLLNALTGERHVETEDKLFKTLDPTTRRLRLETGQEVLLTDTVGFIRRLPHHLVAAFRATLEEVHEADLLLHVVDGSHPNVPVLMETVRQVLEELDADQIPTLLVINKVDLIAPEDRKLLEAEYPEAIFTSAITGEGLGRLREQIASQAAGQESEYLFRLSHDEGRWLSYLYEHGRVEQVEYDELGITVVAALPPRFLSPLAGRVLSQEG